MNPIIDLLRKYGHQYNPLIRRSFDVLTEEGWRDVTPATTLGQMLICSYQQMLAPEHEELCLRYHSRAPHFDGELGPSTEHLLELDRCGCPDYVDEKATGSGSWRPGCVADYPYIHAVGYSLDDRRFPSSWRSWWPEISERVHGAYAEIGLLLVKVATASQAQINVSAEVLAGSTIGLAQLPPQSSSARCERGFFCKLDPGYAPSANQVATLWAHELGHTMGSGHISGDKIMHPSIQSGWGGSFRGTRFGDRLSDWFGGERVGPDPTPKPPTPGPGVIVGTITVSQEDRFLSILRAGKWPDGEYFVTAVAVK